MQHLRTVNDITHTVVSVDRGAASQNIVESMRQWRISALPVVADDGWVAGVISGADLLPRAQGVDVPRSDTAGQLMTAPAVTVTHDAPLAGAAPGVVDVAVRVNVDNPPRR
ncbi:CBS domain-containing protein [Streptomyces sp. NBC_01320]|uniref:CBS domain-containing protein n=1 Tax=Streptomyces sp. NBC_01320 TaxID=2903824 RepID=UPI002E1674D2|nr:CBS domain-containing protein [Streptomyces sp. NBC_01320]